MPHRARDVKGSYISIGARKPRTTYQHGNLREALLKGAVRLVKERGIAAFSLAEAARRAGVSAAAPYRHFRDRSDLLAAVATEAYERMALALARATAAHPTDSVAATAAMAKAYVDFAGANAAAFSIMFEAGLTKSEHPALAAAGERVMAAIVDAVAPLAAGDPERVRSLVLAVGATAHGFAMFRLHGALAEHGVDETTASTLAADAVREIAEGALSRGRPRKRR